MLTGALKSKKYVFQSFLQLQLFCQNAKFYCCCKSYFRDAAIAQWIRLCLPFCHPGSNPKHINLCFYQCKLWHVEKMKINKNRGPGLAHF